MAGVNYPGGYFKRQTHTDTRGRKKNEKFMTNMESEYPIEYHTAARRPFLISFNTDYILFSNCLTSGEPY